MAAIAYKTAVAFVISFLTFHSLLLTNPYREFKTKKRVNHPVCCIAVITFVYIHGIDILAPEFVNFFPLKKLKLNLKKSNNEKCKSV